MKYKTVKLPGHPRSGSHWFNRLIDINFFDGTDYLRHYGGHPFGDHPRAAKYLQTPGQAVIYTHRSVTCTTKSIYKMRHRFGLIEDDYEKFCNTPMKDMYNANGTADVIRDTMNERIEVVEVDALFRGRPETVPEYITKHKASWGRHVGKGNFMMVSYDDLATDFHETMLRIAHFLGSDKTEFIDENKRVGWRAKSDDAWQKP